MKTNFVWYSPFSLILSSCVAAFGRLYLCGLFLLFTSRSPNTTLIILIKNILLLLNVVSFCLTAIDSMLQNKHLATRLDYNIIIAPRNKKWRGDREDTPTTTIKTKRSHTQQNRQYGRVNWLHFILRRMRHHHRACLAHQFIATTIS
jgi:hypothetical protein